MLSLLFPTGGYVLTELNEHPYFLVLLFMYNFDIQNTAKTLSYYHGPMPEIGHVYGVTSWIPYPASPLPGPRSLPASRHISRPTTE